MALIARLLQDLTEDERRSGETQVFVGHEFRQRTLRVRLESSLKSMGMEAYFADKHVTGEYVLDKICRKILVARASIVDLSHANPNVYFELGVAIGLNKPVFIVCQHDTSLPSLLESFVKLHFSSYASLEKDLAEKMPGWLQESVEHHLLYNTHCQFVSVLCPDRQRIAPTRSYLVIDELETQMKSQVVYSGDANFQAELPTALDRFQFAPSFLGAISPQDTYRLCDYCRTLRATSFVLCHLAHLTSLNCYLLLGLAIGLGVPTLLLVRDLQDKEGKPLFELPRMLLGLDSFVFEDYVDISEQLGDAVEEFLVQHRGGPTSLQPLAFHQHARRPEEGESPKYHEEMETSSDLTETPSPREDVIAPKIVDVTSQLPRNTEACIKRPANAIRYIVINHTGTRPEVSAERVAQAQIMRWPGIVSQYFITEEGEIQQTSSINEVVARDQEWIFQGINIYVAGNFDEAVPSNAQLTALVRLCKWLIAKYQLSDSAIRGVSEFIATRSPGRQWLEGSRWHDTLLNQVRSPDQEPEHTFKHSKFALIVGITGTIASGKSTIAEYLVRKHGFLHLSLATAVYEEVRKRNLTPALSELQNVGDSLRREYGTAVLAQRVQRRMETLPDGSYVVLEGIKNVAEVHELRKWANFLLLAVDASEEIRFQRMIQRSQSGSQTRSYPTEAEFHGLDRRDRGIGEPEWGQGVDLCVEEAGIVIQNNGTLEHLYQRLEDTLSSLTIHTQYSTRSDRTEA